MKFYVVDSYEQMSEKGAELIAAQLLVKPTSVLGLATGSSPVGLYKKLIEWNKKGILDFSEATSVNLDEYVGLDGTNDQSYRYFMQKNLFDSINIRPEATFVPNGCAKDFDKECEAYDARIRALGGIDIQLLGIGLDGHIGFNEPADAFVMGTNKVELTASTIDANQRFFAKREDVPTHAYTMGIGSIMKAKRVLLVVNGVGKAQAVKDCFFGPIKPQAPGSILQLHPDFILVADEAALSLVQDQL